MQRRYPQRRFRPNLRKLQPVLFGLFVVFIAYKILTPPKQELQSIQAPDGNRTARLRRVAYYENHPSYTIDLRIDGEKAWTPIYRLPAFTNAPPDTVLPTLEWSADSTRLDFLMNGTSIWHCVFKEG